jgi:hypothetical protein
VGATAGAKPNQAAIHNGQIDAGKTHVLVETAKKAIATFCRLSQEKSRKKILL